MLLRASGDLGLDLGASWMVGDMISDVLAGINAGCRGSILCPDRQGPPRAPRPSQAVGYRVVADLPAAADVILATARPGPDVTILRLDSGEPRPMKILLTGGAGYIGSACLRWLLRNGHDPIAYDNLSRATPRPSPRAGWSSATSPTPTGWPRTLREHTGRGGDALRRPGLGPALDRRPGELLPGQRRRDQERPRRDAGRRASRKIVFSSTAATYGFGVEMPLRETSPQIPETPYGTTKLAAEWLIKDYARAYGLGYTLFRYFNASGADPDGQLRREPAREGHIIPLTLHGRRRPPREAQDLRRRLGHPRRDLRARLRPHRRPGPGPPARRRGARAGRGAGTTTSARAPGTTILEVLRACEKAVGRPIPHEIVGRRPGDPGDPDRHAREDHPRAGLVAPLPRHRAIVETAWRWHEPHPDGYGSTGRALS